jgi:hypothetical protein
MGEGVVWVSEEEVLELNSRLETGIDETDVSL